MQPNSPVLTSELKASISSFHHSAESVPLVPTGREMVSTCSTFLSNSLILFNLSGALPFYTR